MGDRIGLKVIDKDGWGDCDVVIHSHWMGRDLLKLAQRFMNEMKDDEGFMGDDAKDPARIIACFIMWIGKNDIKNDITIEDNEDDCEDNGIFIMNFQEMTVS